MAFGYTRCTTRWISSNRRPGKTVALGTPIARHWAGRKISRKDAKNIIEVGSDCLPCAFRPLRKILSAFQFLQVHTYENFIIRVRGCFTCSEPGECSCLDRFDGQILD